MIIIEKITKVPKSALDSLMPYAQREFMRDHAQTLLDATKSKWVMLDDGKPCFICGIYEPAMLGNDPEYWLLLCKNFNVRRHLKPCKYFAQLLREGYPRIKITIDSNFRSGRRFAEVCGFKVIKQVIRRERSYELYGVVA